ncbi:hypothetical protein [Laceyella sacchari]|jgi:hypothetical protein|uniref:Uncharacterized protein n=1 Tax=Laceyella sacchari TaxID=37482 RepID=A0ABY5U4A1_LACSH|nr:hypothetical protein [Laceyella sacchari]TCW40851.1 hypothetical protein EDC32_101500 [Laceyella sacchari]UWE04468.1 hypothetical protein NYR52_04770 [Laceyella sacchari]
MRSALKWLISNHAKRNIVDPITNQEIAVSGLEDGNILIDMGTTSALCEDREEAMRHLEPIYDRFRSDMPYYLEKIVKSDAQWRFFDVTFAMDIIVRLDETGRGWQVWMGEDLSLLSADPEELLAYLRGLVLELNTEREIELQQMHRQAVGIFQ